MSKSVKIYYSKIEEGLIAAIVLAMIPGIAISLSASTDYTLPVGLLLATILLLIFFTKRERYSIDEQSKILETRSTFSHKKIPIDTILEVQKHTAVLSTPTLSFNTIAITSSGYSKLIISPKEQKKFLQHLIEINPTIQTGIKI